MGHSLRRKMVETLISGLLILSYGGVQAEVAQVATQIVTLKPVQFKALGIELLTMEATQEGLSLPRLPARVQIPNDQLRIIVAPTGGLVTQLQVAPGDRVRRGQLMAVLSSSQALELQRDVRQSASQANLLEQNLRRDEQLYAEGLIPESRLQATRAASTQARAQAQERRAGLALSGMSVDGGAVTLRAPLDGVVLEQGAQVGQHVEATTAIYKVARLSPLWLEIQVPTARSVSLRTGQIVRIAGFSDETLKARLISIGRQVDASSQTVIVRAVVTQGAEQLMSGQVVEVSLDISKPDDKSAALFSLPRQALMRHEGVSYVFVRQAATPENLQFEARVVKVEQQGQDGVQVSGLHAGDRVAVKGVSALKALLTGVGKD